MASKSCGLGPPPRVTSSRVNDAHGTSRFDLTAGSVSRLRLRAVSTSELAGNQMVVAARDLAIAKHRGVDRAGRPYIQHPARVAARVQNDYAPAFAAVAWMHDLIEDEDVTPGQLEDLGFPPEVVAGVIAMTKLDDDGPDDAINRACRNPLALIVKAADVADNTDPTRLAVIEESTRARLLRKYARYREVLDQHGAPVFPPTVKTPQV